MSSRFTELYKKKQGKKSKHLEDSISNDEKNNKGTVKKSKKIQSLDKTLKGQIEKKYENLSLDHSKLSEKKQKTKKKNKRSETGIKKSFNDLKAEAAPCSKKKLKTESRNSCCNSKVKTEAAFSRIIRKENQIHKTDKKCKKYQTFVQKSKTGKAEYRKTKQSSRWKTKHKKNTNNMASCSSSCEGSTYFSENSLISPRSSSQNKHQNNHRSCSTKLPEDKSREKQDMPELPGFYYDKEKKKYFKILPNNSCIGKAVTKEAIKMKEKEKARKSDLLNLVKPRTETPRRHQLSVYDNCLPCVTCNFQQGLLSRRQLDHTIHKIRLKNLNTTPQTRIQIYSDIRRDWLERLENATQLEMIDNKHIIGLFSLKDSMIQRILWLKLSDKPSSNQKDRLSLSIDPFPSCRYYQSAVKISSMSLIDKDSVLYTGMVYTGTPESLVFIKGFGEGSSRYEVYSLGQKATWTCAWNKHANQFSVGSEKCGLLLDVQTRRLWEINTHNSDVLCQVFSKQNGNCLYSGTRNSQIFTHDLRSISTYAVNQLTQSSSVCGLQLLQNDVHLLASDVKGQVNLWDLRTRKVVTEYLGMKNEYLRIPIHVDQSEEIVYGVDQEGYTRLWCLQTGELLKTIPPPMATSYDFFPSVLYSKTWNDRQGNTGLLMGLGDKVYVYSDYTDMAIHDC